MKNKPKNNRSYLGNDDSISECFSISFISLYLNYNIFVLLSSANLTSKV